MPDPGRPLTLGFLDLSIASLHRQLTAKVLSPLDVARRVIDQVQRLECRYHAWTAFDGERLEAQYRERAELPERFRILELVPAGVKDIFNTIDYPTQMGSPLWQGFTPGNDARSIFDFKESGGVVAGKTVTAEFAVHALGKTLNPHHVERSPGTSSSGSAVAVATGMVPLAFGTQTAGSIIRPASFCGVYGFKPSFGLIPRTGMLKTTDTLDTVGFFVSHECDLTRCLEAVRVHGPNYPFVHKALSDPSRRQRPAHRKWQLGFVRTHLWEYAEDYARAAILRWCDRLANDEGYDLTEITLPAETDESHRVHEIIYNKTLSYYFREEYKRSELISPIMNECINAGLKVDLVTYRQALEYQNRLAAELDRFMTDFDALVCLSTAGEAPPRAQVETLDSALLWTLGYLPALSAPVFQSPRGLPFGLQLVGRRFNDLLLLQLVQSLARSGHLPAGAHPLAPPFRPPHE